MQGRPVQAQAARSVGERPFGRHAGAERAEVGAAAPALVAFAARGRERENDVVAGRERSYARPDLLHDSSGFVAENERKRLRKVAVDDVQVAVAHTAGCDPDEHLTLLRRSQVDLEHLHGPARLPENGRLRLHGASLHPASVAHARLTIALCAPLSSESCTSR